MSALDFKLYFYQHNELFKKVAIKKGDYNSWLLGGAEDAHITLNNARISKHHLQIIYNKDGELYVQDLGSTNGTFLNGIKLEKSQLLKHKDKLQLAGINDVLIIIEKPTSNAITDTQNAIIDKFIDNTTIVMIYRRIKLLYFL